jgi:hypothetical protein
MHIIEELRVQRKKFLDGLKANEGDINLDIFEDFYPDKAHFVFELLQNAEDAKAKNCEFALSENELAFIHDGTKHFSPKDVRSITGIHNSTKTKSSDSIGKFGVGFKSVFIYTLTPYIYSKDYSFLIEELVMPTPVPKLASIGEKTAFKFPFNNPSKKPKKEAHSDISKGLQDLTNLTLLFLTNIESIKWEIKGGSSGELIRIQHSEHHIEILKSVDGRKTSSTHFLRFNEPVDSLENQNVSIAFELDRLPKSQGFLTHKSLHQQFRIVAAHPGRVAVFFPAEKETSGLRFHLHAPFASDLSRSSVKDTSINAPLFQQLAQLTANSLYKIQTLHLLNSEFLGVLPNLDDEVTKKYIPIRDAIINEMKYNALTPGHDGKHYPATQLIQAKAPLKALLSANDIKYLVSDSDQPPAWAISANQKNSAIDRFLTALDIQSWGADEFIDLLECETTIDEEDIPDSEFMTWLSMHDIEWHRNLYKYLFGELTTNGLERLEECKIILLQSGKYSAGEHSYFPDKQNKITIKANFIHPELLLPKQKHYKEILQFLESLGARSIGEKDLIKALLEEQYSYESEEPDFDTHIKHLDRFIKYYEKNPGEMEIFEDYWIILSKDESEDKWSKPEQSYLCAPLKNTNLEAYCEKVSPERRLLKISEKYHDISIPNQKLSAFFEAVGVMSEIPIEQINCSAENPEWDYLNSVPGERYGYSINRDYQIPELTNLLKSPNIELSRLIWNRMVSLGDYASELSACKQINETNGAHYAKSLLIHTLKNSKWIPQNDGSFTKPVDANASELPEGFAFDKGDEWLKLVEFGLAPKKNKETAQLRSQLAKAIGFKDAESLQRAKRFGTLPVEEQQRILEEHTTPEPDIELPERKPKNPERRRQQVKSEAKEAPKREFEKRERSVSKNRDSVKAPAEPYLRDQYTRDDYMICQICQDRLPFKLDNGMYHFEKHELLPELKCHHKQNYIALCPNHGAMFKHINHSKDDMKELIQNATENEITIMLGEEEYSIYFTKTHLFDLQSVIESEEESTPQNMNPVSNEATNEAEEKVPHKVGPVSVVEALGFDPRLGTNHYERQQNDWTGRIHGQRSPSPTGPDDLD